MIVGGIFEAGFGEFDSKVLYARLDVAQKIFGMGSAINALEIRVEDPLATDEVVAQIEERLSQRSSSFQILDWRQMNRNIFSSLAYQKLAIVVVMLVMVFLAACNAACLLMMMINERVREIAILRAIGLSRLNPIALRIAISRTRSLIIIISKQAALQAAKKTITSMTTTMASF